MRESFGQMPMTKPEGMFKRVRFPQLAMMDVATGDGRLLEGAGRGVRDLPRTIYGQFTQAPGHDGAVVVGALHEVVFDDDGLVWGRGWLIDDANGRKAAKYIATQALRHNSVDLNNIKVRFEEKQTETGEWEFLVRFTQWKIGATTIVGKPAFENASVEMDELVAAMLADDNDDELVASFDEDFQIAVDVVDATIEVEASVTALAPYEAFFQPEPNGRRKVHVDPETGWVSGHLALWDSRHESKRVPPPRPDDGYASFNQPGVPTDRGPVEAGPIAMWGGHTPLNKVYDDPTNAWADVRVTEGRFGPWCSGFVRPGTPPETVYAGSASRVSGHWLGRRLKAIVACNNEAFPVGGGGFATVAEATFGDEGELLELVASFDGDDDEIVTFDVTEDELNTRIAAAVEAHFTSVFSNANPDDAKPEIVVDPAPEAATVDEADLVRVRLMLSDDDEE